MDQIRTQGQACAQPDYVFVDNIKVAMHYELQCGRNIKDMIIAGLSVTLRGRLIKEKKKKSSTPYGTVATVRHLSRAAAQGQEAFFYPTDVFYLQAE